MKEQVSRREFWRAAALTASALPVVSCGSQKSKESAVPASIPEAERRADITLRIGNVLVEVAPHQIISTVGYNGSVPAPLIRLHEGQSVVVDLFNDTDVPELVHWHGQFVPTNVDGASEEGTPAVPPHGKLRYSFIPRPSGTRWVHTHTAAGPDLYRGTYTGQFGFVYIEPRNEPGRYDREVFLATHEWEPFYGAVEDEEQMYPAAKKPESKKGSSNTGGEKQENGLEIGYRLFSINGKALGQGEPIRVKAGERVMLRILNASATEIVQLALPGHEFEIVAMDGNPVPTTRKVHVLTIGTAERIDAIVEMNRPGVWILGTPKDDDRRDGMGIVVEYAGQNGKPRWLAPPKELWDYTAFGRNDEAPRPDETIPMVFQKLAGGTGKFNHWTINGQTYEQSSPIPIRHGARYRLEFENQSDDNHPLHLHRHTFELVSVNGTRTSGVRKDVVVIPGFSRIDVDFVADNPGLTLFHCHQQLHMDYGFMRLFKYV
jgi:FtsP/CotA-like multicopper oxidase with cupredoxin domain